MCATYGRIDLVSSPLGRNRQHHAAATRWCTVMHTELFFSFADISLGAAQHEARGITMPPPRHHRDTTMLSRSAEARDITMIPPCHRRDITMLSAVLCDVTYI